MYRLAQSPFANRFILKGALLLTAWRAPVTRPTIDIDLAGKTSNEPELIAEIIGTVCDVVTEPDGIEFNRASIEAESRKTRITRARVPMQIDIGFGGVIAPGPTKVEHPTMFDFPAPVLQAYPRETVIAGKLEGLTALGLLNSRMKDYYDLALLSRMYPFEGEPLLEAILVTFQHRGTKWMSCC